MLSYMGSAWQGSELVINYSMLPILFGLLAVSYWFHKYSITLLLFSVLTMVSLIIAEKIALFNVALDQGMLLGGFTTLLVTNVMLLSLYRRRQMRHRGMILIAIFMFLQTLTLGLLAFMINLSVVERIAIDVLPKAYANLLPWVSQISLFIYLLGFIPVILHRFLAPTDFIKTGTDVLLGVAIYNAFYFIRGLSFSSFFSLIIVIVGVNLFEDIYHLSYLDQLTQIPSRRALQEEANKLTGNYTVAMADIDFFKKFNDKYGHDVGDQVLAFVASILHRNCKGMAFRYGGEEFTLVFPKSPMKDCIEHLDDVRQLVADSQFRIRGYSKTNKSDSLVNVTISIGVAEYNRNNSSFDKVIKAADVALYRAKKKGRNCVSK